MMVRVRSTGETFDPASLRELGTGGEARVLALPGDPPRVVKLYHRPDEERRAKAEAMMAHPPRGGTGEALAQGDAAGGFTFAWPADVVLDGAGGFAGFVMPRARGRRVFELYNPATRRDRAPRFHTGTLHRVARNVAAAFAALHAAGYVLGDVNESNVVVGPDGSVTLVDCDSFQVREPGGALHRSRVGRAEFTPPEMQGADFGAVERTAEHDRFGLAVLLFHLLMEGTHPFAGQYPGGAEPPAMEARIREGHFAYAGRPDAPSRPPRLAPPFGILHPELQALFLRCFTAGHADPSDRPSADEWVAALEVAEAALVPCEDNARHHFGLHLGRCPWCERTAFLGGRDPFPAPGTVQRKKKPARPRRWESWDAEPEVPILSVLPTVPGIPGYTAPARVPQFGARRGSGAASPPARRGPAAWIYPRGAAAWLPPVVLAMAYPSAGSGGWLLLALPMGILAMLTLIGADGAPTRWSRIQSYATGFAGLFLLFAGAVRSLAAPPPMLGMVEERVLPPSAARGAPPVVPEHGNVNRAPRLRNGPEVQSVLSTLYPSLLRDAGIEGEVLVAFAIDEGGRVIPSSVEVAEASHEGFTNAAIAGVMAMHFDPALEDGRPVRILAQLPIDFSLPVSQPRTPSLRPGDAP